MKKFITNNWKKILIIIGIVFIVINLITKLTVGKTLLSDYIKYGKDIERPEIIENVGEVVSVSTIESPFGPDLIKFIMVIVGLILLVVILTSLGDKAAANSKAKKK